MERIYSHASKNIRGLQEMTAGGILREWRKFLKEEKVKYQGILLLKPDERTISKLEPFQHMLPEEAIRLDKDKLHVTLIHQSILNKFKKRLKNSFFPEPPKIILEDEVWERESLGKKSWALRIKNQDEMRDYVRQVMQLLGSENTNPEPERIFHISIANLTGNPSDSVR